MNAANLQLQADLLRQASLPVGDSRLAPHVYPSLPWNEFPDGGQAFDYAGVIGTPAAAGAETVALSFITPYGWDGVVKRLSHNYTGGGFVPGSGDLTWRIRVGGAFVKNYEAITVEFGTTTEPRPTDGIRVFSGQLVEYIVNHAAASGLAVGGTNIICFLAGWFYPRGPG